MFCFVGTIYIDKHTDRRRGVRAMAYARAAVSDEGNFFGVFGSCVSGGESMSVSQLFFST